MGISSQPMMFPKTKPWRSKEYLDFIRWNPCWICRKSEPSEAHHWGPGKGMGKKVGDQYTTPLCRVCHQQWHNSASFGTMTPDQSRAEQMEAQRYYMGKWFDTLEADT